MTMIASRNGKPPTIVTVTTVITTASALMILRPKSSAKELSMPTIRMSRKLHPISIEPTFEIFSKAIQKTASRHRVMKADLGKQDSFQ